MRTTIKIAILYRFTAFNIFIYFVHAQLTTLKNALLINDYFGISFFSEGITHIFL